MDHTALVELVAQLYTAMHLYSGYPVPEDLPRVNLLPKETLQNLVCERVPCSIRAFYHPHFGVLLDEALNLNSNVYDQSVLLHELVHHAQDRAGRFEALPSSCERRAGSESEAYEIQNRYLAAKGYERIPTVRWGLICNEEGSPLAR